MNKRPLGVAHKRLRDRIGLINRTKEPKKLVDHCDAQTVAAFEPLVKFIGTDDYKTMKRIRNAVTSHYETEAIEKAIERSALGGTRFVGLRQQPDAGGRYDTGLLDALSDFGR